MTLCVASDNGFLVFLNDRLLANESWLAAAPPRRLGDPR
jgi:hypothetical protein